MASLFPDEEVWGGFLFSEWAPARASNDIWVLVLCSIGSGINAHWQAKLFWRGLACVLSYSVNIPTTGGFPVFYLFPLLLLGPSFQGFRSLCPRFRSWICWAPVAGSCRMSGVNLPLARIPDCCFSADQSPSLYSTRWRLNRWPFAWGLLMSKSQEQWCE